MYSFWSDFFALEFDFIHILGWVVGLIVIAAVIFVIWLIVYSVYHYYSIRSKKHLNQAIKVTVDDLVKNPNKYENEYVKVYGKLRKLVRRDTETSINTYYTPIMTGNSTIMVPHSIDSTEEKEYWTFVDGENHIIVYNDNFEIKSGEKLILYGYWERLDEDDEIFVLNIELAQNWIENN